MSVWHTRHHPHPPVLAPPPSRLVCLSVCRFLRPSSNPPFAPSHPLALFPLWFYLRPIHQQSPILSLYSTSPLSVASFSDVAVLFARAFLLPTISYLSNPAALNTPSCPSTPSLPWTTPPSLVLLLLFPLSPAIQYLFALADHPAPSFWSDPRHLTRRKHPSERTNGGANRCEFLESVVN